MEKSHSVELGNSRGRVTFVDDQDSAMIVDFDQMRYDNSSGSVYDIKEDMHVNIYELSPAKYKTYRLIKKLSKSGAEAYLEHQKPVEHLSKRVYSYYDIPHPGAESEYGSTNFTTNIKEGKYETDNEMVNQIILRSQDLIYEEIQTRAQTAEKKRNEEKQAETAEKNAKFSNFLPNPEEVEKRLKFIEAAQEHRASEYITSIPPGERPSFNQLFELVRIGDEFQSFWKAMLNSYRNDDECVNEIMNVLQLLNVSDEDLKSIDPRNNLGVAAGMLLKQRRLEQEKQNGKDDFMAWMAQQNEKIKD